MKIENAIIKKIHETQAFGEKGFRVRKLWLETQEQYPQVLEVQFTQDKTVILDSYAEGQIVDVSINLQGREWTNAEGKTSVFNTLQAWKINVSGNPTNSTVKNYQDSAPAEEMQADLPF